MLSKEPLDLAIKRILIQEMVDQQDKLSEERSINIVLLNDFKN
jgi:hypothetical protein